MKTDELIAEGFEYLTNWQITFLRITPRNTWWEDSPGWIYSFSFDAKVQFIGRTEATLRSQLGFITRDERSLEARLRELITSKLLADFAVEIYGRKEPDGIKRASEEGRLVQRLSPPWNLMLYQGY